jgi:hypothetical protein
LQHKYHDIKFFLVAIAFISAFNYYLTYNHIQFNWFLILTYSIDTVEGWLAWWLVRSIIIYLDKKMPYAQLPLKRILIQLLLTTAAGLTVIILLTELESWSWWWRHRSRLRITVCAFPQTLYVYSN